MPRRHTLAKMIPRRFVPDSETTLVSGNDYSTTFVPLKPEKVYQGTTELAFSWDAGTLTFTVVSGAPDSNIFADYPLYFSNGVTFYLDDNPVDETGGEKEWLPRLAKNIVAKQSGKSALEGKLSTSSITISLINQDYALNAYLTKYDNYKNRPIFTYAMIGDNVYNLSRSFIASVRAGTSVSVKAKTPAKLFDSDATLGNSRQFTEYSSADYPGLDGSFENIPIPVTYGALSSIPTNDIGIWTPNDVTHFTALSSNQHLFRAPQISSTEYLLGIVDDAFNGEVASLSNPVLTEWNGDDATRYTVAGDDIQYFLPGVNMWGLRTGLGSQDMVVQHVDYGNRYIYTNGNSTAQPYTTVDLFSFHIFTAQTSGHFRNSGFSDSSEVSLITTDSGQKLGKFTYGGSFPGFDVFYTMHSKPRTQTSFIQSYLESTGFDVDATSFSEAQTQANENVMLTVNQEKIESIHDVLEKVSTSCNGILYLDPATNEYKYRIINDSLSGYDFLITDSDILEPDLIPNVDYQDTADTIRMNHAYKGNAPYMPEITETRRSEFSQIFNSESKNKNLEHYLEGVTNVIDYKAQNSFTPKINYSFSLDAEDYYGSIEIGNIVRIENDQGKLLNGETFIDLVILELSKSSEEIKVVGYEFSKIP